MKELLKLIEKNARYEGKENHCRIPYHHQLG